MIWCRFVIDEERLSAAKMSEAEPGTEVGCQNWYDAGSGVKLFPGRS